MKYLIIGAGGTGGPLGAYLANAGKDVTFLARGAHLDAKGAYGLYYRIPAGGMQSPGEARDCYIALMDEIAALGKAMGVPLEEDCRERNLAILDSLPPDMTTSLQKDVAAGKRSEIDGLVFQVVRMGRRFGVPVPTYEKIAAELSKRR